MKIVHSANLEFVPASHEDPTSPGVLKKVLLKRDDISDGAVQMINWSWLPAGKSFRQHYHEDLEEIFIILQGVAKIVVDDEMATMGSGDVVIIPAGCIHSMENIEAEDVLYIAIGITRGKHGKTVVV